MKESQIEESILEYLSLVGGVVLKIPNAGFFNGSVMRKHHSIYVQNGISDIFYMSHGRLYCFEVKTPVEARFVRKHYDSIVKTPKVLLSKKKQHLQDQIVFLENVRKQGFIGEFVCSISEVKNILKK